MDDLERIDFTAINSGLGLQESKILLDSTLEELEKISPPVSDKDIPSKPLPKYFTSLFLDLFFILFFYSFFLCTSFFLFNVHPLLGRTILVIHLLLLGVVSAFYYLFFKQFKIPTLGQWVIFRAK